MQNEEARVSAWAAAGGGRRRRQQAAAAAGLHAAPALGRRNGLRLTSKGRRGPGKGERTR